MVGEPAEFVRARGLQGGYSGLGLVAGEVGWGVMT